MSWKDKFLGVGSAILARNIWNLAMEVTEIRLSRLLVFMYKMRILKAIGSMVGNMENFDFKIDSRTRGRFARMAVFINLDRPLVSQLCPLVVVDPFSESGKELTIVNLREVKIGKKAISGSRFSALNGVGEMVGDECGSSEFSSDNGSTNVTLDDAVLDPGKHSAVTFKENTNLNKDGALSEADFSNGYIDNSSSKSIGGKAALVYIIQKLNQTIRDRRDKFKLVGITRISFPNFMNSMVKLINDQLSNEVGKDSSPSDGKWLEEVGLPKQ
ncbi:hypothetical protein Golax_022634 [Gossypium laxum]|uniref:Uncharacterized protein n=1 Tax=Gossypium laxum TaxID=34288 RepID=A0A7J9B4V3_9ROSI|nr:hypothetical protein [Gossypium laxum]